MVHWAPWITRKKKDVHWPSNLVKQPPRFGTPERQKLIDEIHQYMLSKAPPVPQLHAPQILNEDLNDTEGEAQINQQNSGTIVAGESHPKLEGDGRIVEDVQVVRKCKC
uniref:Uncharacterized protein n=1 Tax=Nelumbo nucifera TaxID=4432 RepID=A0A822YKS7_NELNU|nr:TPA_asm: hypothetical protein HUJ06_011973 [Nelumbo nucifera]